MNKKKSKVSIEEIEDRASKGEDTTMHFEKPKKMPALAKSFERLQSDKEIQRVNVDFTTGLLTELDAVVHELNVSRQSVIKMMVRSSLDRHYMAKKAK